VDLTDDNVPGYDDFLTYLGVTANPETDEGRSSGEFKPDENA